ncbi:MAG: 50S ribosomal protein L4 [Spirochaetaceae bacterium]|nr:50S ribosomal protein L4 [Spirochaetaceae bacterium]
MEVKVFSIKGEEIKAINLDDAVFNCEVSEGTIYYAINNELANMRLGTASTKNRGEVKGSGAKPWAQKGTGRARAGHKRSPLWIHGGVIFGPRPKDYSYKMPKAMKQNAMKSILSLKNKNNSLKVVEDFTVESGKTKDIAAILNNLVKKERTVLILKDNDSIIKRAGKNIPWLSFLSYDRLRAHDLFYGKNILLMESAALKLNDFYGKKQQEAAE